MRIVFDTNIYIAAALRGGFAEDIIALADKGVVTLVTSNEILSELEKKLLSKFNFSKEQVDFIIRRIKKLSSIIIPTEKISKIQRDPEDNKILECALSGKANLIVSSDQDLIQLKIYEGIPIIHPKTLSYTFPQYFKPKKK
jgi:putative PIN family toxin of toxin-antitoxin system